MASSKRTSAKLPKGIRKRGTNYYLNCKIGGVYQHDCCGPDIDLAIAELAKRKAAVFEGKFFPDKPNNSLAIRQILEMFWDRELRHIKSGNNRRYFLDKIDTAFGYLPWIKLRQCDVEDYRRQRATEPRKIPYKDKETGEWKVKHGDCPTNRTINAEVAELIIALNWAKRNRIITFNPIEGLKKLDEGQPKKIMVDQSLADRGEEYGQEYLKLYGNASDLQKKLLFIQYHTGMRIREVLQLNKEWIDFDGNVIRLPHSVCKNNNDREVPITPILRVFLLKICNESENDLLFFNPKTGKPYHWVFKGFREARRRAGISSEVTSHALRRTRLQIWDNIDPRLSCAAGGHTDDRTHEKHYTRVSGDMLQKLVKPTLKFPETGNQSAVGK